MLLMYIGTQAAGWRERNAMVTLSLRPLLRQPLSLSSRPPNGAARTVQLQESSFLPSNHGEFQIASSRCGEKRNLPGLHLAQIFLRFPLPCRGPSSLQRKSSTVFTAAAKTGDAKVSGAPSTIINSCRGRGITAGERVNYTKNIQRRITQLVGYTRSVDDNNSLRRSAATQKASPCCDGVECVDEDEELDGSSSSQRSSDVVLADGDVSILTQYVTRHNFVRVLEVSRSADSLLAGARVLLLDKPGNVHSIYQKYRVLTDSYYDIMAAIPAVIPEGPVGILGLGAGTVARLIDHFWPEIDMHGWELDPGVMQVARKFFDLEELEWKEPKDHDDASGRLSGSYGAWKDESDEVKLSLFQGTAGTPPRERNGRLRVHVGDALGLNVSVEGGFAGLIVDLFAEGAVIPALQQIETWREMKEKLRPGGRIMVNCGGLCVEAAGVDGEKKDGGVTMRETIAVLAEAFPGELSITSLREHGDNYLALTGPPPDFRLWRDTLPECLRHGIEEWRPFSSTRS